MGLDCPSGDETLHLFQCGEPTHFLALSFLLPFFLAQRTVSSTNLAGWPWSPAPPTRAIATVPFLYALLALGVVTLSRLCPSVRPVRLADAITGAVPVVACRLLGPPQPRPVPPTARLCGVVACGCEGRSLAARPRLEGPAGALFGSWPAVVISIHAPPPGGAPRPLVRAYVCPSSRGICLVPNHAL